MAKQKSEKDLLLERLQELVAEEREVRIKLGWLKTPEERQAEIIAQAEKQLARARARRDLVAKSDSLEMRRQYLEESELAVLSAENTLRRAKGEPEVVLTDAERQALHGRVRRQL